MGTIYLCIVIFLLCLAVFDLFVGVSNDAVNFLQSAIGAKVAKFRTVLIIASCGVVLGAIMSSGMMDIARHGIMSPDHFTFEEVMTLFLAVMVTDVIVLDVFNTLGMPTSTTVSLVFEMFGDAFTLATLMAKEDYVVGVALRIVSADDAKECGLACSVLAAESPVFTVHDGEAEVLEYSAVAVADIHLAEVNDLACACLCLVNIFFVGQG